MDGNNQEHDENDPQNEVQEDKEINENDVDTQQPETNDDTEQKEVEEEKKDDEDKGADGTDDHKSKENIAAPDENTQPVEESKSNDEHSKKEGEPEHFEKQDSHEAATETSTKFDINKFVENFAGLLKTFNEFNITEQAKPFDDFKGFIKNHEEKFVKENFGNIKSDLERIIFESFEKESEELEKKIKETKESHPPKDEQETKEYLYQADGKTTFSFNDIIDFYGSLRDGYYDQGVLLKKEGEKINIYNGKFHNENNIEGFEGIYLTKKEANKICSILGTVCNNEISGCIAYTNDNNEINRLFYGKLVNNNPVGNHITVKFNEDKTVSQIVFIKQESEDKTTEFNWVLGKYLISLAEEALKAIYYTNDEFLYKGDLAKNEDKYELTGEGILLYQNNHFYEGPLVANEKQGRGVFYNVHDGHRLKITGVFEGDLHIKDVEVMKTTKDNPEGVLLFTGVLKDKRYVGNYRFGGVERFVGSIENGQKIKGCYTYPDGMEFEGEWENDKKKSGEIRPIGQEAIPYPQTS
jgi:hypothetical protein